jgi:hypothetical protein
MFCFYSSSSWVIIAPLIGLPPTLVGSATAQQIINKNNEVGRSFMTVKVERPPKRGGDKPLYINLGVRCLATIWHDEIKQPIAFRGGELLFDWWCWTRKIAKVQSRLARVK